MDEGEGKFSLILITNFLKLRIFYQTTKNFKITCSINKLYEQ